MNRADKDALIAQWSANNKRVKTIKANRVRWMTNKLTNHLKGCAECQNSVGPCAKAVHIARLRAGQGFCFEKVSTMLGELHAVSEHEKVVGIKNRLEVIPAL